MLNLIASCQSGLEINRDRFCDWYKPITITKKEFRLMTRETKLSIRNVNREYKIQCLEN